MAIIAAAWRRSPGSAGRSAACSRGLGRRGGDPADLVEVRVAQALAPRLGGREHLLLGKRRKQVQRGGRAC
jgi:hypothetical protein